MCDNHPHAGVACHSIWGWLSHALIQLVDDGYHNSQAVRAGDYFIFKLKFPLYGHVMYILIG